MADNSHLKNKDLLNELIIIGALSFVSIIVGIFLLMQSSFEFWLTKPIGVFCLLFPIISALYYLKLQFKIELEKGKFLDRILSVNPSIVLLHDINTKKTYVLNGTIPTLEYSEEEFYSLQDDLFSTVCSNTDLAGVLTDLQKSANSDEEVVIACEWKLLSKSGAERPFEVRLTKIKFNESDSFIIAFIEDIFEKKSLIKTVEKNRERMAEMEKFSILKNLGSGVAHEIANPLAAIKGRTQILRSRLAKGNLETAQIIEGLDKVEHNADRINNTIHALRQLTKDNSKELVERHHVYSLFEDIERVWGQRLRVHGFEFDIPKINSDMELTCRKSQIETALFNLISNSFEQLAGAENKWLKIEAHEDGGNIIISVTDSGQGVPSNIRDKIFNPFYSSSPDKSTGLGLSIALGIAQAHGGTIELDTKNINTRFNIIIPKIPIEKQQAA